MQMNDTVLHELNDRGFEFGNVRGWIDAANKRSLANDAALITTPNTTVPVEFTAYIDPEVVEILTGVRNARKIFSEKKVGDWTTQYMRFPVEEVTGGTQPYSDFANGITSDVNTAWPVREQYVFQTTMSYGDYEQAVNSMARLDLAARKQRAAAEIIDIDANKFALLGVAGKGIYGILNDPNLPAATAVNAQWSTLTSDQIYNDIIENLFNALVTNSGGHIDSNSDLVLCMSPAVSVYLEYGNTYGKTVKDMLKAAFGSIDFVTLPELASMTAGDTCFMIARYVAGTESAKLPFGLKFKPGRVVPKLSSFEQKFTASTYGGLVLRPFAFASITGM